MSQASWSGSFSRRQLDALLQEVSPNIRRIGIMYNPNTAPYAPPLIGSARASATAGVVIADCHTRNDSEIEAAVGSLGNPKDNGLLVIPEPFTNADRDKIIAQCDRFGVPTLNPVFGAVNRGALISYTYAFDVMMRQPASYIDRILRGESPTNSRPGPDQIRAVDQSQSGQSAWPERTANAAGSCGPSDRVMSSCWRLLLLAFHGHAGSPGCPHLTQSDIA